MAREIGNWKRQPDARTPRAGAAHAEKQEARIAKALAPGETIVTRIPLGGLAIDSFNILFWSAFIGFSVITVTGSIFAEADGAWLMRSFALFWTSFTAWGVWNSFTLPTRQIAVLTNQRIMLISFAQTLTARRAEPGKLPEFRTVPLPALGIQKLLIRGTPARGSICLGQLRIRRSYYPPFTLFGVERPAEVAAQIKQTLKLDLPVTDKTR